MVGRNAVHRFEATLPDCVPPHIVVDVVGRRGLGATGESQGQRAGLRDGSRFGGSGGGRGFRGNISGRFAAS